MMQRCLNITAIFNTVFENYFKTLYTRTMEEAYRHAHQEILSALTDNGLCLDCGASSGHKFDFLQQEINFPLSQYSGIEWSSHLVKEGQNKGLNILQGDLNQKLPFPDNQYNCIFGLSVLEHLINPCHFLKETHRCLKIDGTLVILTPNISTFFTMALLLFGKMPSTGPHPDSDALLKQEELFQVSPQGVQHDTENDTPVHRHFIVFSYKVLRSYLQLLGFREIRGYGYGLYPFPNFTQNLLQKLDPWHCHQMVFTAKK